MPVDVAFMQPLCERVHQQCRGNADVEALRESVHRNLDIHVGMLEGVVGEAGLFGAENHGYGLVEWEGVEAVVVLMRACGHYFIAFAVQIIKSLGSVELADVVFVQVEPFAGAHHDVGVDVVNPFVFNDMDVLHAGEIAAAQNCAGIVRLIDVLKHHGEVACAEIQHLFEALFSVKGDVI